MKFGFSKNGGDIVPPITHHSHAVTRNYGGIIKDHIDRGDLNPARDIDLGVGVKLEIWEREREKENFYGTLA